MANGNAVALDPQQWARLRERLIGLLEQADTESLTLFESNRSLLQSALGPHYEPLATALDNFDFEDLAPDLAPTTPAKVIGAAE